MAQVRFTKLKLKVEDVFEDFSFEGENIKVRQYLPSIDKIKLVSRVVTQSLAGKIVRNDLLDYYLNLEIIFNYTNIAFTDKQLESLDLYDKFEVSGLFDEIISRIPEKEYNLLVDYVNDYSVKLQAMSNELVSGYTTQTEGMKDVMNSLISNTIEETFKEEKSGDEEKE